MEINRKQEAIDLDREVRKLICGIDKAWLTVGRLCERCRKERLHQELGFERFDDWLCEAVGMCRSRAYVAMRVASNLVPNRDAELAQLTVQNADILSRVPKSKQLELLEAAQTLTEREFRQAVDDAVPDLHLESSVHVEFWVPRSLADVIERCIEKAKILNQTESRTEAVEAIFAEYDIQHETLQTELKGEGLLLQERQN